MANDYRILDERDKNSFQAGNKLNVTEIGNKVTYEHIGNPPDRLPLQEQILEYGKSFDITVPSVYDSTGHVKSETTYSFVMPEKDDASGSLTINNFDADSPISVDKQNGNITYSHNVFYQAPNNPDTKNLEYGKEFSFSALSDTDGYGHANQKTTYKFKMPAAPNAPTVDISKFPKTENFSADEPIIVTKDTNNNTVKYSHKTVSPVSSSPNAVSLEYGKNFSFSALSAADDCGHANQTTTYTFTMPAAPSGPTVDTSGFLTTSNFKAGNLINVATNAQNKTVTYSHKDVTVDNDSDISLSLNYGGTVNFTIFSDTDGYGHVNKKAKVNLTMPEVPTVNTTILEVTNKNYNHVDQQVNGKWEWEFTFRDIPNNNYNRHYITICPQPAGAELSDYDTNTLSSTKLFLPGSIAFYTNSLVEFKANIPALYILVPKDTDARHGFSNLSNPIEIKIDYNNSYNVINFYVRSDIKYVDPYFIDKIIITSF